MVPTPSASMSHEKLARRVEVAAERGNQLQIRRADLLGVRQRHRVDGDMLADDELHAGQADACVRAVIAVRKARSGLPRFTMIAVFGNSKALAGRRVDLERHLARIDRADLALGAGDGDVLPVAQRACRCLRSDHGGNAKFARDNRGVAGAPAAIGDDRRRPSSSPAPSRGSVDVGDQNLARPEAVQILGRS